MAVYRLETSQIKGKPVPYLPFGAGSNGHLFGKVQHLFMFLVLV